MNRTQWILLGAGAALFALLYWGLERRPPDMRGVDSIRVSNMSSTSANALIREASSNLNARQEAEIHGFEKMLDGATSDSRKVELLKQLSGAWYRTGNPAIAGHYAEEIAKENPDDVSVLVQLGRLALQTNQNDKALGRLTRATELEPDNRSAQCLLSEAARRTGNEQLAASSESACRTL